MEPNSEVLRTFLHELASGVHDDVLDVINTAVKTRTAALKPPSLTRQDIELAIADNGGEPVQVVFNSNCGTRYLYETSQTATVVKVNNKSVLVKLDEPMSERARKRFGNSEKIRCPLGIVDLV